MTKIYVKYIKGTFYICDIDDADFSIYSEETDYDKIIQKVNDPKWKSNSPDDIYHMYLGYNVSADKGYDFFKSCKRVQKIKYIIDKIKK